MYFCIDMKCFFASVECAERGLNPMTTPLVVADESRGQGSLCLAVSPYLKQKGVKNRGRLYEIPKTFSFIIAKPRMKKYIEYAVLIHRIFLKYVDALDIHTYSIDEAFLDVTSYLHLHASAGALALKIMKDIHQELGIVATCGAGDNLFLAKISLDLLAKKMPPYYHYLTLDEFYDHIWFHSNLKDIWQIGSGIAKRLNRMQIHSLRDVAMCDVNLLKKEFGVIGLDLYEHAWGIDTTTIADIKAYQPITKSFSRKQILFKDYSKIEAWIPLVEMLFLLAMDLVSKDSMIKNISFYIGYSGNKASYHKMINLDSYTDDFYEMKDRLKKEYEGVEEGKIRRIGIVFSHIISKQLGQNNLFYEKNEKYERLSQTFHQVWEKYGKNNLVIGTAICKESTLYQRNNQIGGHNRE